MSEERAFILRQVDQARTDFAAIEDDLEFLMQWINRLPTASDMASSRARDSRDRSVLALFPMCPDLTLILITATLWLKRSARPAIFARRHPTKEQ